MSFFCSPSGYSRFPFYDVSDSYPYSSSPPHQYSSFDPLGLTHLQNDLRNTQHPSPYNISRDRVGRDPLANRHARHTRPYPVPANPTSYEDSIRAERARRLAEAKMRQIAQSKHDEQTKVEITLPDGRQCLVPLSWAKKMQSKYPNILTNSMIQPHNPPSLPSVRLDPSDSDHDSDFYVLDPTQDPSVPSVAGASSVPIRSSPSPQPRPSPSGTQPFKHSPEELDSAARLIQQQFRTYQSLRQLDQIESTTHQLKSEFTYPSPLDLTFIESPQQSSSSTPPKLAFNNPVNRSILAFEEGLTQLQIKADAVVSRGNLKVKNWRKKLIKEIELQLEQLDRFKNEAWNSQKSRYDTSLSSGGPDSNTGDVTMTESENTNLKDTEKNCDIENNYQDVEMNDNDDNESSASNHSNNSDNGDSNILHTPLATPEVIQPMTRSEENLVIPITAPLGKSLENLVIPASTPSKSNPDNPSPCIVNPTITQEGDLVCPAPIDSHNSDDILVSPV